MIDTQPPLHTTVSEARPRTGLAVACLALGLLSVFSSVLLVGGLFGLGALLLGVLHISRRRGPNGMAWAGLLLSVVGLGLSAGLGVLYVKSYDTLRARWGHGSPPAAEAEAEPAFADWIGRQLPAFTVTTLQGESLQPSQWQGRRVILDFWATWCPPCRREIPHFMRLSRENPPEDLRVVGISSEDQKTLQAFVDKEQIPYPIVSAKDLPAPFDAIEAIPITFFIDRNGRIQDVLVGYHDYEKLRELALADDLPADAGSGATGAP